MVLVTAPVSRLDEGPCDGSVRFEVQPHHLAETARVVVTHLLTMHRATGMGLPCTGLQAWGVHEASTRTRTRTCPCTCTCRMRVTCGMRRAACGVCICMHACIVLARRLGVAEGLEQRVGR